jgi:DNA polymerase V
MKSFYASIELVKRNIHPLKGYLAGIGDKKRNLEKGNIKDRIESTIGGHKK